MASDAAQRRAETFELFFDLMFVFAITQITHLLETARSVTDWVAAIAVLLFLWWMYGGFVWLASNATRLPHLAGTLMVAMLGFFLLACGIPGVHDGGTLLAGGAALAVVAVHSLGFVLIGNGVSLRDVLGISWVNALAALLLLGSGFVPHALAWIPQSALILLLCGMAALYSARAFTIIPSHFVERHGLLLIIVFGESIIAVGTSLGGHPSPRGLLEAGLVVLLVAMLWYSWFSHDDRRSEHRLAATPSDARGRPALVAYWLAFAIMIFGILLLAAGTRLHFHGEAQPAPWIAAALAFYFAGMALFRRELKLVGVVSRVVGAGLALLIWPLGSAIVQHWLGGQAASGQALSALLAALVLAAAMLAIDRWQIGASSPGG